MFLIDAFGAVVSVFFLGVVLVWLEEKIGMPKPMLWGLALLPCFFAVYSFYCYLFATKHERLLLKIIAVLNGCYCLLTLSVLFLYDHSLSFFGWLYFIAEIVVLLILIFFEFKIANKSA